MSTTSNDYQNGILKDIITTPYMKVLSILKEAKKYIAMMSKSQSKLIRDLDWTIKVITSHSLYTYEFTDSDLITKYQQENEEFKQFIEFVSDYNEEVIEVNKKNNLVLTKTAQISSELNLLQTPSFQVKKTYNKYNQATKKKIPSNTFISNSNTRINLNSLKQVMKNGTLTSSFNNNTSNNFSHYNTSPLFKHSGNNLGYSKTIVSLAKFNSNKMNNQNNKVNIKPGKHSFTSTNKVRYTSESPGNQHKRYYTPTSTEPKLQKYSFISIEGLLAKANYDPKKIITRDFDIFELKSIVGHENVLPLMGKTILDTFGINDKMINVSKLDSFLISVSNSYLTTVLYHNSIHGADVTHTVSMFFLNSNAEEVISTNMLDILSILIASLGHDVGHPGLTNNFQINSNSEMALTYNDISCLENYHTARLFRIIKVPENNIFDKLSLADFKTLRKRIISMILATDMANHGKVMSVIKARIKLVDDDAGHRCELLTKNPKTQFEEQQALLDYFIHAADLAHNTKLFSISLQWVELLSNEFWLQGDKEKSMNLPVSFLCERVGADIPNSQVGFIKGFILPTFDVLVQMFPTLNYMIENAKINLSEWQKLVAENRKTGWTPRNKEETHKKSIGSGNIEPNVITKKRTKDFVKMGNQSKKTTFTANWGRPKLIIVHKTKNSEQLNDDNKK